MRRISHTVRAVLILSFLLGNFRGYLALWEGNDTEPKQIFPVKIAGLAAADQEKLTQGIPVRNHKALERLLEDYLS